MLVLVPTYLHYRLSSQEGILPGPDGGMPFRSILLYSIYFSLRNECARGGVVTFLLSTYLTISAPYSLATEVVTSIIRTTSLTRKL